MARGGRRRGGPVSTCPVCGNPVRDAKTAVLHKESGTPAHFDCVVNALAEHESLEKDEKIVYLGKGTFGVLSYRQGSGQLPYVVRKRIHYEDQDRRAEWRSTGGRSSSPDGQ